MWILASRLALRQNAAGPPQLGALRQGPPSQIGVIALKDPVPFCRFRLCLALVGALFLTGCGGSAPQQPQLVAISWQTPAAITYGTALSGAQLNATAPVPGTFAYSPAAGTALGAGSHRLTATFTPEDESAFAVSTASVVLTVYQATPVITWPAPAAIAYGTGISNVQLDATANVPGTFSYTPPARTVLAAGTQTLSATFTPADPTDYTNASASVQLPINLAAVPVDSAVPSAACTAPTPWPLPSTSSVVGNGTSSSCTEAALSAAVAAGGLVSFNCGSGNTTIPVTSEISVTKPTVIDGGGAVTLDGGGANRILHLQGWNTLSVRNLRLINGFGGEPPNGRPTDYLDDNFNDDSGGAIKAEFSSSLEIINSTFQNNTAFFASGGAVTIGSMGTLTVTGSVFDSNQGGYGGAIYALVTNVDIRNSMFTNNGMAYSNQTTPWYPGAGGAVNVDGAGASVNGAPPTVSLCGVDVENNFSSSSGGGLSLWIYAPEQIIVDRSTFRNNRVWVDNQGNAKGGGVSLGMGYSDTPNVVGTIIVKDSTFLSNIADVIGGGLNTDCDGGPCSVTNSTFFANTAGTSGSDHHNGGWGSSAWIPPPPYVTLDNDTFADGRGNDVGLSLDGRLFVINNSVFLEDGPAVCNLEARATGSNVLQYSANGLTTSCIAGGILSSDPQLSDPANNGGPTLTMLPAPASPLIDAGSNCEPTDQRGEARGTAKCTIGAVEVQ